MDGTRTSRRELLHLGLAGASLVVADLGRAGATLLRGEPRAARASDADMLDQALERLHERVSSEQHSLSNHVPMCAEALATLGRADAIRPWVDAHLEPVEPDRRPLRPLDPERWREALGRPERFLDWRAFFLEQLRDEEWTFVLRQWSSRFVPGLAGAATHGVIRTAHAVRALAARDVEIRRTELGAALAYWASRYEELPWDGTRDPEKSVAAAIARVQPRRPTLEPPPGFIVDGLRALRDTPSFAPVAGLVDVGDPARTLSEISALFAGIYLRNPDLRIHFAHTVTAPSAVRLLAPYLDDEDVESATRYAWQAAAGLYAVYHDPRSEPPADEPVTERGELVERAVANGAPHAIKLVEVCLREEAIAQDPVRLRAALDAARSLTG